MKNITLQNRAVHTLSPADSPIRIEVVLNASAIVQSSLPFRINGATGNRITLSNGQFIVLRLDQQLRTWYTESGSPQEEFISSVEDTATINLAVSDEGELTGSFASMLISQFTNDSNFIDYGDLSAVAPLTYDNTTGAFSTSVAADKLLGRGNGGGAGVAQEITISTGLTLTGTTLTATGTGGTVTNVATAGLITGGPITTTGTITSSVVQNRLVGRGGASGTGIFEEITLGTGLSLSGTTLNGQTGTVTSVDGDGGTTGLTLTGGPITTSGTLTLGGTLVAANGGNGNTLGSLVTLYFAGGLVSPADADIIYIGPMTGGVTPLVGTPARRQGGFPYSGTIIGGYVSLLTGTAAPSGESSTFAIRINNTTDHTLTSSATFAAGVVTNTTTFTGLSIAITAGQQWEIKWTNPTYAGTNPANTTVNGMLYLRLD